MPWHAADDEAAQKLWSELDKRPNSALRRRNQLSSLGVRITNAHKASEWSLAEPTAVRKIFERCLLESKMERALDEKAARMALAMFMDYDTAAAYAKRVESRGGLKLPDLCVSRSLIPVLALPHHPTHLVPSSISRVCAQA